MACVIGISCKEPTRRDTDTVNSQYHSTAIDVAQAQWSERNYFAHKDFSLPSIRSFCRQERRRAVGGGDGFRIDDSRSPGRIWWKGQRSHRDADRGPGERRLQALRHPDKIAWRWFRRP